MKYFISNDYGTVYFLDETYGKDTLMGVKIDNDNTFDTEEGTVIDFNSLENESFIYCKGVEAFLKKLK